MPDREALVRLVGAMLAEQHDEWTEGLRNLGLDLLARARAAVQPAAPPEELVTDSVVPAHSA